jgi:peptidoglycan/xylan/chitin deacetylase (PgdA/CDA1 family)
MKRVLTAVWLFGVILAPRLQASESSPSSLSGAAKALSSSASLPTELPVICYHRFGPEEKSDPLKIAPKRLAEQLRWLRHQGYESVNCAQVLAFMQGHLEGLPAKPILLSVDDGYRSGWSVGGPIFNRYGFKAVYFIITDQVGASKNFLNWDDLQDILAHGFEVQSHTMDHTNLGKPVSFKIPVGSDENLEEDTGSRVTKYEMPIDYHTRLRSELEGSRKVLEEKLGITITTLAYPFGAYNPVVQSYAQASGYQLILTVSGGLNLPGDDPLRARRIILVGHPTLASFIRRVTEKRLKAIASGIDEGVGFFPEQLPHTITIRLPSPWGPSVVPRADIGGRWIPLTQEAGTPVWDAVLGKKMRPGFYFFKIEAGDGLSLARDSYLFEIYRPNMHPYMVTLSPDAASQGTP